MLQRTSSALTQRILEFEALMVDMELRKLGYEEEETEFEISEFEIPAAAEEALHSENGTGDDRD